MQLTFEKSSLEDILTVSQWHTADSVREWIYINDWAGFYNAVKDNPGYFLFSVRKEKAMVAFIGGEILNSCLALFLIVDPAKHGQGIETAVLCEMVR
jgi:hypothetical protein